MNPPRFFAGLDIGKQHDHSALAVLELRTRQTGFDRVYWVPIVEWDLRVRRLTRFPLGTSGLRMAGSAHCSGQPL